MLERDLERKCRDLAHRMGFWLVKNEGTVGFPDRTLLLPGGCMIFIEFKTPRGKLTKKQELWRDRLQALGFTYQVIRDLDSFRALLEEVTA